MQPSFNQWMILILLMELHCFVTWRNSIPSPIYKTVSLIENAAIELRRVSMLIFPAFPDLKFANDIVKHLGGFPLALSNAGVYINSTEITFETYYKRITEGGAKFINTVGDISKKSPL